MRKRIMAFVIVVCFLVQSISSVAYAADAEIISDSTEIVNDSAETVSGNAETVSDNAGICEDEQIPVEESSEEEGTIPPVETIEAAEAEEDEYLVDTSLGYALSNVMMNPGSYVGEVSFDSAEWIPAYNVFVLYTTDSALADDFFPGVTKISASDYQNAGYQQGDLCNVSDDWMYDNSSSWYRYLGEFSGEGSRGLAPNTTYYYRLIYQQYNGSAGYEYYFLSLPESFTTGDAVTETALEIHTPVMESEGFYNKVRVSWTIENPNKEYLKEQRFVYTTLDDTNERYEQASEYRDESGNVILNKYYADIYTYGQALKGKAACTVFTGDNEENTRESDEIVLEPLDMNKSDVKTDIEVGTTSANVGISIAPFYKDDYVSMYVFYRKAGTTDAWLSQYEYLYSANGICSLNSLSENTEYEYYLECYPDNSKKTLLWNQGTKEQPFTFVTKQNVTYEDSDFPDEVFRNYLKKRIGIAEAEKLTSAKLETVKNLACSLDSLKEEITSIEGIQYVENLTSISFNGQGIKDASEIKKLTALETINFENNDLTVLPDMSGMKALNNAYFSNNVLVPESITADKLPAGFLEDIYHRNWLNETKRSQRKPFSYKIAPVYYAIGETQPFILEAVGIKNSRRYTLSVTIDDKTTSCTGNPYNGIFIIPDLGKTEAGEDSGIVITPGKVTASVKLVDEYGSVYVDLKDTEFVFAADVNTAADQYIQPDAQSIYLNVELAGNIPQDTIKVMEVVSSDGTVIGTADSFNTYTQNSENRYNDVFEGYVDLNRPITRISGSVYFARYLSAGDYDIRITTDTEKVYYVEKAIHVSNTAMITSCETAYNYDQYGEYIYVRVKGNNLNGNKVRPVFYEGGKKISEFVNVIKTGYQGDDIIYKLKKLDKDIYWTESADYSYVLEADAGYDFIDKIQNHTVYISCNDIVFEHYNYKKGYYEVKLNSTFAEGTEIKVSVYAESSYRTLEASGMASVKNGMLSLKFTDSAGKEYQPPREQNKYFVYEFNNKSVRHSTRITWYNYYEDTSVNDIYVNFIQNHEIGLKSLDVGISIPKTKIDNTKELTAIMYTAGEETVGSFSKLNPQSTTVDGVPYWHYQGKWTSETGLGEGVYRISFMQEGKTIKSGNLFVYDTNKFYLSYQYANICNGGKDIALTLGSEKLASESGLTPAKAMELWNKEYKLEIFDRFGKELTGWKVSTVTYGYYLVPIITGLPQDYFGYYFKVSHKQYGAPIKLSSQKAFYAEEYNANEQYGKWTEINRNRFNFFGYSNLNATVGLSIDNEDLYPVVVKVTKPYDTEVITSFTASSSNDRGGLDYYFTKTDLNKVDPKEVYTFTATANNGQTTSTTGYFATSGSEAPTIAASGVTLDKTTLNMAPGEEAVLLATVKPENATNKNVTWSSDNTAAATVDDNGKVVAVAAGQAVITVTTHNGKTAKCTVHVYEYSISKTEVTLDISKEEKETLTVSDGITDIAAVWTSSDETVVKVTGGVLTPVGAGTAVVRAAIKNGPVLTCNVTVTATLKAISIRPKEHTLKIGDTYKLQAFCEPASAKEEVTWLSSDETVVKVEADGTVTALKDGEAVITAKAGECVSNECTITVLKTTDESTLEVPTGITAITNLHTKLSDVKFEQDAWSWIYGDTPMKTFAGVSEKSFLAEYRESEDAAPVIKEINVNIVTVSKATVSAENVVEKDASITAYADLQTIGSSLPAEYVKSIAWKSDKEDVAIVTPSAENQNSATVKGIKAGTANITVEITVTDGEYETIVSAKKAVKVTEDALAVLSFADIDEKFTKDLDSDVYTMAFTGSTTAIVTINSTYDKVTLKSSDNAVMQPGAFKKQEDGVFTAELQIKKPGYVRLTATANDVAKTSESIDLYVKDAKANLSSNAVTLNNKSIFTESVYVYPNETYSIEDVNIIDADSPNEASKHFEVTKGSRENEYIISIKKDSTTDKGDYKTKLLITVTGAETYETDFKVKVVSTEPKVTVKQTGKVNPFYLDHTGDGTLTLTSDEVITSVELKDCDFTYDSASNKVSLNAGVDVKNLDKKGTLSISCEGYKQPIEKAITIAVENKKPKLALSAKSGTLYPVAGIEETSVSVMDVTEGSAVTLTKDDIVKVEFSNEAEDNAYEYVITDTTVTFTRAAQSSFDKKAKAVIWVEKAGVFSEPIKLMYTIAVDKKAPSLVLSKKTLTLNMHEDVDTYETDSVTVSVKNAPNAENQKISIAAADAKAQEELNKSIAFSVEDNIISARLNNNKKTLKAGNYKFTAYVDITDTCKVKVAIPVKIVNTEMEKTVKLAGKGTIDILNRNTTSIVYTPKLSGITGNITGVALTGRSSHLFDACLEEDGKIVVTAKENAAFVTKYAYGVKMQLTFDNGYETCQITTNEVKIKVTQSKPKLTVIPKQAVMFNMVTDNTVQVMIQAQNKDKTQVAIESVTLTNFTDVFAYEDGQLKLMNRGTVVRGKTYSLKFAVRYEGCADNEKLPIVTYKVKMN